MSKTKPAGDVPADEIKALLVGEEYRAFRVKLAKFIADRRRCQEQGYGKVTLVTEFHASVPTNSVEIVEREREELQ